MTVRSIVVPEDLESSDHRHSRRIDRNHHHAVPAMGPLRIPLSAPVAAHDDSNLVVKTVHEMYEHSLFARTTDEV